MPQLEESWCNKHQSVHCLSFRVAMIASFSNFLMTFSYGRALQQSALKKFSFDMNNRNDIQKVFNHRAKMNSLSSKGQWTEVLDKEVA